MVHHFNIHPFILVMFFESFIRSLTLCDRGSKQGPHRPRGAAAAAAAMRPGRGRSRYPRGHGLEHHGRRVFPRPELSRQPPAEAGAERREGG